MRPRTGQRNVVPLADGGSGAAGRDAKLLADTDLMPRLQAVQGNDVVDTGAVLAGDRIERLAGFDDMDGVAGLDLGDRRRGSSSRRHHLGKMDGRGRRAPGRPAPG